MRVDYGPLAADLLFVLAGYGVLNGFGLLRSSLWDFAASIGLAFLAGLSAVATLAIALMTVGIPLRLWTFVALSAATAAAGLLARRDWLVAFRPRRIVVPDARSAFRRVHPQALTAVPTFLAFLVYAGAQSYSTRVRPLVEWDSWSIWSRKGEMLFHTGTLQPDFFASSAYIFMHADYPLLIPVFESIQYGAMGTIDTQAIHMQFFLLLVAFVLAVLYLGLRRGTLLEWLPLGILAAFLPAVSNQLLTAYADIPMALFLALGLLLLGEWLMTGDRRMLALSIVMLLGSANTKNEGLLVAVLALVVAGALTALRRRRSDLKALGIGGAALVAGILPWRVWMAVEGIHGDIPILRGLSPSYLADRTDRISPSLHAMYHQLIDQAQWYYVVPFAGALTLVSLLVRGRRTVAAFYLATGLLAFVGIIWVYWISPTEPVDYFLATSDYRVIAVLAAIAFAALLQLVPRRDA